MRLTTMATITSLVRANASNGVGNDMQAAFSSIRMNGVMTDQGILFTILVRSEQNRDFFTNIKAAIFAMRITTGQ